MADVARLTARSVGEVVFTDGALAGNQRLVSHHATALTSQASRNLADKNETPAGVQTKER